MIMKDTIEILDKDTNTKQTYVLQEEQEESQNGFWFDTFPVIVEIVINLIMKAFKFSLYLCVSFLELWIKIIKTLFLSDYKPFGAITGMKDNFIKDYISKNTKPHAKVIHSYEFTRSEEFAKNYSHIDNLLKECAKSKLAINEDIHRDIMKRLDIILVESEKMALSEGFSYCKQVKYKIDESEAYESYIQDQIMKGN